MKRQRYVLQTGTGQPVAGNASSGSAYSLDIGVSPVARAPPRLIAVAIAFRHAAAVQAALVLRWRRTE